VLYFLLLVQHPLSVAARKAKQEKRSKRQGPGRPPILSDRTSLTTHVDGTDYAALSELAEERGVSLGTVVREAISAYVARRRKE
jgi:hypothetical protein